jgi:hypothetical protein
MGEPDIHLKLSRRYQDGFSPIPSYAEIPQPQVGILGSLVVQHRLFVMHAPRNVLTLEILLTDARCA